MYYILGLTLIYSLVTSIFLNKKYRLINESIIFLIFIFFIGLMGFRYGVGRDYFTYETGFYTGEAITIVEPTYSYLIGQIKKLGGQFYHVTFFMALATNIIIYLVIKKKKLSGIYLCIALIIYISDLGFIYANIMKQGLAIAIFFYSSKYIKERKLGKYLILIVLGSGFHYSMFIMIPMYWTYNMNISKKLYIILILAAYFMVSTGIAPKLINTLSLLDKNYSIYHNSDYFMNSNGGILSIGVLIKVILSVILIILSDENDEKLKLEINFYKIGVIINILSISTFMYDRIGMYFSIFSIVAIPGIIKNLNKNKKLLLLIMVVFIYSSIFIKNLIISPESLMLEYNSVFTLI